jgi:ubiquinone/menaquinone biosynthesis C-methylase UbiE
MPTLDVEYYRDKSWGNRPIQQGLDLPTLKMRHLLKLLSQRVQPAASLLEVGSGSGRILASIRAVDAKIKLTGIDLSTSQTELAARTHPSINFVCGNGESLPFPDESFDYVIFFDYLEHIEKPAVSLREMYRVLKRSGCLHMVCPAEAQSIYGLSTFLFGRHFKETTGAHIQQFTRENLRTLVTSSGLSITHQRYSYHILGSCMDYALFTLMLHPHINKLYWAKNQYYAKDNANEDVGIFGRLLKIGNAIAYLESNLLQKISLFATAVHITAVKP